MEYGSLLMTHDGLPRDSFGEPFQVVTVSMPGGRSRLHRDADGRVLRHPDGIGTNGLGDLDTVLERLVPAEAEVAAAAEAWESQGEP